MSVSVKEIALKDIVKYLNEVNIKLTGKPLGGSLYGDYVSRKELYTKETLRLNKQLGLHKINKNKFGSNV